MEHHHRPRILRILFGLALFTSVVTGPYPAPLLIALLGYVLFPLYWEMLFAAMFFDLLYYASSPSMHGVPLSATMLALTLLWVMVFLGERLRLPTHKRGY